MVAEVLDRREVGEGAEGAHDAAAVAVLNVPVLQVRFGQLTGGGIVGHEGLGQPHRVERPAALGEDDVARAPEQGGR